jgi:isopentenyldiphosphate isomerase
MKTYQDAVVVDEDDSVVGHLPMPEAYRQGKILRVVHVVVLNNSRQVLLQKRGPSVMSPGLWQESASGHVDWGDDYHQTAVKELEEEMGISGIELREMDYFFRQESPEYHNIKRFHKVFLGRHEGPVHPNDEVGDYQWIDLHDLATWVRDKPSDFTPSIDRIVELILEAD